MQCDDFPSASFCTFCCAAAINIQHPGTIGSRHMARAVHVVTPTATRDGEKQQATTPASHSSLWALRALKEPAIGCGYEISALSRPCSTA
jgi:hypothetical protein